MHIIRIEDIPPLDGEYPIDLSSFNGREIRQIKQISGARANEIKDALRAGDYDIVIALALIAIERAGKVAVEEMLLEAEVGKITLDSDPASKEPDVRPPDSSPTQSGSTSLGVGGENENEKKSSSGSSGNSDGENHQATPPLTGGPGSGPSAV